MKKIKSVVVGVFCFMAITSWASAQIKVTMGTDRQDYLLYEKMVFDVKVTNISDSSILLKSRGEKRGWLKFLIFRADESKVGIERDLHLSPLQIASGETKMVSVDITPYYELRSSGQYTIKAVVYLPGRNPVMTSALTFNVGLGSKIWKMKKIVSGTERQYSLIRFVTRKDSNLYLRVEEPTENLVYSNILLGKFISYTQPTIKFDTHGNIHVMHPVGKRAYRHTILDHNGLNPQIEDRLVVRGSPALVKSEAGEVSFEGGLNPKSRPKRSSLSEGQLKPSKKGS